MRLKRLKEKELEKIKRDSQIMKNKQNAIDNLQSSNVQPYNSTHDVIALIDRCKNETEKEKMLKLQMRDKPAKY